MSGTQAQEKLLKQLKVKLAGIERTSPKDILPNPSNPYAPLSKDELSQLVEDISAKGVLVPLIVKREGGKLVLVCGHNRRAAAIAAGLQTVPFQEILTSLTPELEQDIMKSENDRRRGGKWSSEKKDAFIQEHFREELQKDKRGGDRKSKDRIKGDASLLIQKRIAEASKGAIGEAEAKKRLARLRKDQETTAKQRELDRQAEAAKRPKTAMQIRTAETKYLLTLEQILIKLPAAPPREFTERGLLSAKKRVARIVSKLAPFGAQFKE